MHPPVARSIFRSFIRLSRLYAKEDIPFLPAWPNKLQLAHGEPHRSPSDEIRIKKVLSGGLLSFESAIKMLRGMNDRLHVLSAAESEARVAMSEWRALLNKGYKNTGNAIGIEEASMLLARINSRSFEGLRSSHQEGDDGTPATSWASEDEAQSTLNQWALELKQTQPHLFLSRSISSKQEAVATLAEYLFSTVEGGAGRARVFNHPIEWLYDGTGPLLVTEVLRDGKGSPLALALIASLLGLRLGLSSFPIPLSMQSSSGALGDDPSQGHISSTSGQELPDSVVEAVRRHRGRAAYVSPPVEDWGVVFPCSHGTEGWIYLDVSSSTLKRIEQGEASSLVLSKEEMRAKYPHFSIQPMGMNLAALCTALVRSMVVAHQRRGESDLVSFYLYQLLALDPSAQEWSDMLLNND